MITWEPEFILMLQVGHAQQWHIVLILEGLICFTWTSLHDKKDLFLNHIWANFFGVINELFHRLFSCGTDKNGESFLVEWNESEGGIKRTYQGLSKNSSAVVQFGTTKDKFLAAADDHVIKIWDMDKVELLTTIDAEGGLPVSSSVFQSYFLRNVIQIVFSSSGRKL